MLFTLVETYEEQHDTILLPDPVGDAEAAYWFRRPSIGLDSKCITRLIPFVHSFPLTNDLDFELIERRRATHQYRSLTARTAGS